MTPVAAPLKRSRAVLPLAFLGAFAVLALRVLRQGLLFASPEAAASRRNVLLSGALATAAVAAAPAAPVVAAEFPLLGKVRGPFEVDPKEAIIVGDINSADQSAPLQPVGAPSQFANRKLPTTMAPVAAPLKRSRAVLPLAVLGASAVLTLRALSPGLLFASPEAAASRRNVLLSAALAAAAVAPAAPAVAAEFPLLGKVRGPFEVDPKEAIIVGDINSADSKAAKVMINRYLTSVEEARAALDKDEQSDITTLLKPLAISEIRQATNSINNLMDDASAAGVQ
eukprot:CAMPEP_0183484812 /NCGR_PEP_ID=MMETSP0370-20130417/179111_1 /TAXON_ID=268820 /ORGANISM="Peridinium aciculiferum, Strain PAER-2" /LENGTH=282 /DNA_ID=CAMNT_0025678105 /DNA_START=71 /DNA_END=916 /DNA_ORIENTATION=-